MPDRPDYLTDPARARFRAAQGVAVCADSEWVQGTVMPEGEELWHEDGDRVILTPEKRLVYVNGGGKSLYARLPGLPATRELVRALRGSS